MGCGGAGRPLPPMQVHLDLKSKAELNSDLKVLHYSCE